MRDSDLKPTTKLIAHTLATYMNKKGSAYPSKRLLAIGAGYSPRSKDPAVVTRAVSELEANGLLRAERRRGRTGWTYQAVIPPPEEGFAKGVNPLAAEDKSPNSALEIPSLERGESDIESVKQEIGGRDAVTFIETSEPERDAKPGLEERLIEAVRSVRETHHLVESLRASIEEEGFRGLFSPRTLAAPLRPAIATLAEGLELVAEADAVGPRTLDVALRDAGFLESLRADGIVAGER